MSSLWEDLVNSDWRDHRGSGRREDRLGNDQWLERFLARTPWGTKRLPGGSERSKLRQLRQLLQRMVTAIIEQSDPHPADFDALNRMMAHAPVVRRLERNESKTELTLIPLGHSMEAVLGEVATGFATLLADGDPRRIRICANPDCGWVMVDESRNRTRRWCDKTECGNLIKVRRHRQRKKAQSSEKG